MKLNGWQRLWLSASVVYTAFIVFAAVHDFRSSDFAEKMYSYALSDTTVRETRPATKEERFQGLREIHTTRPATAAEMNLRRERAQADYEEAVSERRLEIVKFFFAFLGLWLGGCVGTYVAGLAIAWIIRGFKADKAAKTNV